MPAKGALGHRGWAGPMPIRSRGPHAYVFQLFALDQAPGLPASFTLDDVTAAIKEVTSSAVPGWTGHAKSASTQNEDSRSGRPSGWATPSPRSDRAAGAAPDARSGAGPMAAGFGHRPPPTVSALDVGTSVGHE